MPTNNFVFNGVSASDYGVKVLDRREERHTSRSGEGIAVPGRTGELFADGGRYENVNVIYSCAFVANAYDQMKAFNAKLLSMVGNYELSDDFDLDVDHMVGRYAGGIEPKITRHGDKARVDFTFDCNPKKFLASGATPSTFESTQKIVNPSHVFSEFSNKTQELLLDGIRKVTSYSASDIQDMRYYVFGLNFETDSVHKIRFEANESTPFFAVVLRLLGNTPYNYDGYYGMAQPYSSNMFNYDSASIWVGAQEIPGNAPYIVVQRNAPLRMYIDDELYFEDNYFDYYTLTNPTLFPSSPLLRITVPNNTFYDYLCVINGCSLLLDHDIDVAEESFAINALTFDAETMNAYSLPEDNSLGYLINANKFVEVSGYSMNLQSGENEIWVGDLATDVEVIPRWWTL